jgi:preprotein translocase subunit SecG
MAIFHSILVVVQVLSALGVIGLVLVQQGKGADMGAAFGSGTSGSLFGATGSANFLSRSTAVCATLFFLCTLGLSFLSQPSQKSGAGIMESVSQQKPEAGLAVPAASANKAAPQQPASPVQEIPK